jgi:hypothetical protein
MNGHIALNYRAVLFFSQALGCAPEAIRSDLPEQRLSTGLPTTAAQPLRLDPEKIAGIARVLNKVCGLLRWQFDLTDPTMAELFSASYAWMEEMAGKPDADIELTARVIDFIQAREARNGRGSGSAVVGGVHEGARRKGAA